MDNKLDGNAAGGMLQQIFPFDMTLVQITCTGCNATDSIGALPLYISAMGTIIRCPSCDNALIRIMQTKDRYRLDMHGIRVLQIPTEV